MAGIEKCTPGEWSVHHSRISWWIEAPGDKSRQLASGALPADTWYMTPEERANCQAMANAHVLAASKKMYLALRGFNITEQNIVSGTAETITIRVPIKVVQDAAEALRTAEGQP